MQLGRHHGDSIRSVSARHFTTSTGRHLSNTASQLPSLSSTRCLSSHFICCLSLLLSSQLTTAARWLRAIHCLTVDGPPSQLAEHTFQSVTMNLNFIVRLLSSIPVIAFMVYLLHWGCTKSNWVETGCYSAWLHNFGKCSIGGNSFTLGRIQQ